MYIFFQSTGEFHLLNSLDFDLGLCRLIINKDIILSLDNVSDLEKMHIKIGSLVARNNAGVITIDLDCEVHSGFFTKYDQYESTN